MFSSIAIELNLVHREHGFKKYDSIRDIRVEVTCIFTTGGYV